MPKNRKVYLLVCAVILALSVYPIAMGIAIVRDSIASGGVDALDYPKYVIPYTPISLSLILSAALMPLFARLRGRRRAFWGLSALALAVFAAGELILENLVVYADVAETSILDWQWALCVAAPEVPASEYILLLGEYGAAFKLHFYLISALIILGVLGSAWGFYTLEPGDKRGGRLLWGLLFSVVAFVALCILACFTAFFRVGTLSLSPLSASLTAGYFVLMGLTAGVFMCAQLPRMRWLAVLTALSTTAGMYAGELILLGGELYTYGRGAFFWPLGPFPLAPVDYLVILISGLLTLVVISLILGKKEKKG